MIDDPTPVAASVTVAPVQPADTPPIGRLALIGLGLIGSSIARAVRARGLARELVGFARSAETRSRAREIALVDRVAESARDAARDADVVVLCTPLSSYAALAAEIAPALGDGAILSDVGSVKSCTIDDVAPLLPAGVTFVPAHPIAGTENSGPDAGFASLFEGRWCLITPQPNTPTPAVDRIAGLWRAMGSTVEIMSPQHHDRVLAITSHLPHLIAYTIVGTATDLADDLKHEVIAYSASGFRDFTRIAASDPVMWRDIFLSNKEAVLEIMQRFTEDLTALQRAIRRDDGDALQSLFTRTREIRRGVVAAKQA